MAGILEVTNKAEKEATKLWTVVPEASDAPPETRSGASVDDMLAMAAVYLGVAATAVKPIVLLPAGFGRGTVVGDDAVVLLVDGALNGGGAGGDRTNRRASLLASAKLIVLALSALLQSLGLLLAACWLPHYFVATLTTTVQSTQTVHGLRPSTRATMRT